MITGRPMTMVAPVLALVSLLLAGCSGTPGPNAPDGVPDLFGSVVDENGSPLTEALVEVPGAGLSTRTNPDGEFAFAEVPAEGHVEVTASKGGHRTVTTHVLVAQEVSVHVAFTLASLASLRPEQVIIEFGGFLACWVQAPPAGSNPCPGEPFGASADRFVIPVEERAGESLEEVIIVLAWNATSPGADRLTVRAMAGDDVLAEGAGADTLRLGLDGAAVARALRDGSILVEVTPDAEAAGLVAAQRFDGRVLLMWEPIVVE